MHVMQIIDSMHGGGAETSLLDIAPALARRGVSMSIVTLLDDDGALESRLDALRLPCIRLKHRLPIAQICELRKLISAERPDLIHTTLLFANLTGRIAATIPRFPVVTTLANQDYGPEHRTNSRYGPWGVGAAYTADILTSPLTTCFHAISFEVAKVMGRRLRIPKDKVQVVYRGRDTTRLGALTLDRRLRARTSLSIDAKTPVVLSVGRLDRQKGVDTTVDAFRRLKKWVPNAVLIVAGRPGNASGDIQARARGYPGIRFLGHRTDIPDLMCAADVLSFPSRWEGLGGTLVEAMALRLAIVASDIPPVVETIGNVGWPLVRPNDGQELAKCLFSALKQSAANEARKDSAEARFSALFTAEAAAEGMAMLYQKVLRSTMRLR